MECFLHCCNDTHDPVALPDGKKIIVGRMQEFQIKNPKCSRNQVQLRASYKEKEVEVKQLGKNPSTIGGQVVKQGETKILGPGGEICLLHNDFPHFIYFKIAPTAKSPQQSLRKDNGNECNENQASVSGKNRKRKIKDDEEDTCVKVKKRKSDSSEKTILNFMTSNKVESRDVVKDISTDNGNEGNQNQASVYEKNRKRKIKDDEPDTCVKVKKSKSDSVDNENDDTSSPPCDSSTWEEIPGELLVYTRKGVEGRSKIAGFDMDGTLITTKSGRVFPTNTGDWKIALPHIPGKLKSLWGDGFKIVIFTNQNGIAKKKVSIPDFKKKIENVVQALCVPVQVLISPGTGHFRKPSTGMWKHLCQKLNQGITVLKDQSYYIGDAAGRPAAWTPGKKKDFSCSDRAFAANVGVKFQTPEELFLDKKPAPFNMPAFDPKKLDPDTPILKPSSASLVSKEKEVIVMVGFPASGKSTFCDENLVPKGYVRVNRDILGTWQKCVSACRSALGQGKSVVVDNTNPDKDSRKRYIDCAKEAKVPVRCFLMNVTKEHAQHNNQVREALNTDKNYKRVGFMVYNTYQSAYVEPSTEEGFSEIIRVQFKPKFKNAQTKELYNQFL